MNDETIVGRFRAHPENATAIVNALLVTICPVLLMFVLMALHKDYTDTSATVRVSLYPAYRKTFSSIVTIVMTCAPAGLLAGWRTRVLTQRWLQDGTGAWRGVLEAGCAGAAIVCLVLLPAVFSSPLGALLYMLVYGTLAFFLGLVAGVLLRTATLATLWWAGASSPNPLLRG